MLTQERLKEVLAYDPETGLFTWLVSRGRVRAGDIAGCINPDGYRIVKIDGISHLAARLACFYMTGCWPLIEMDHIDRDEANDRWGNLRQATRVQNLANRGAFSKNSLGLKGVTRLDRLVSKPFAARIQIDGQVMHLGYFESAGLAGAAYMRALVARFGEFANPSQEIR